MPERRFPPPWSVEKTDANGQALRPGLPFSFRPLAFKALRGPALAGLPPAREGFFIASTHLGWERGIVAGPESSGHGFRRVRRKGR
jgi:hypothetical protein